MANANRKLNPAAIILAALAVVMGAEGLRTTRYADPVGIPTVCYGSTGSSTAREHYTETECAALLGVELLEHWQQVAPCIKQPITTHQAAAILSWSYNVGAGAACKSTLMTRLNAGQSATIWCRELSRWVYAGGTQLRGLVKRREAELALCLS